MSSCWLAPKLLAANGHFAEHLHRRCGGTRNTYNSRGGAAQFPCKPRLHPGRAPLTSDGGWHEMGRLPDHRRDGSMQGMNYKPKEGSREEIVVFSVVRES